MKNEHNNSFAARDNNSPDSLILVGTIAQKNPDELKITVGAAGASHQVTFEIFGASLDDLRGFSGRKLKITLEADGDPDAPYY